MIQTSRPAGCCWYFPVHPPWSSGPGQHARDVDDDHDNDDNDDNDDLRKSLRWNFYDDEDIDDDDIIMC